MIVSGHIPGDPCEYGLVGFISTHNRGQIINEKYGTEIAKSCRLGRGLLMTFSWLAAQAYNQGLYHVFLLFFFPVSSLSFTFSSPSAQQFFFLVLYFLFFFFPVFSSFSCLPPLLLCLYLLLSTTDKVFLESIFR